MPDQIDLAGSRHSKNLRHLGHQLFAANIGGIHRRNFGGVDRGAMRLQVSSDAVKIVDTQDRVEAEQSVHQHDRVFRCAIRVLGLRLTEAGESKQTKYQTDLDDSHVVFLLVFFLMGTPGGASADAVVCCHCHNRLTMTEGLRPQHPSSD